MRLQGTLPWMLAGLIISIAGLFPSTVTATAPRLLDNDPARYVNPFIGTDNYAYTFPGADAPFGMVQWNPDTTNWSPGGYLYHDLTIKGFSLTHMNGTGCSTYQDVPFMPTIGSLDASPATTPYTAAFSHADEETSPGYYGVHLASGIQVGLTATPRTGFGSFTYPATTTAHLLINASGSVNGVNNAMVHVNTATNEVTGSASSGGFCNGGAPYTVYFAAQFNQPFTGFGTWNGAALTPASTTSAGTQSGAFVTFDTSQNPIILVKVGVSFVSIQNAQANLQAENPGWDFATARANATTTWNTWLNHVQVDGGTDTDKQTFYTALYHTLLQPNVFSDANGQYIGFDNQVHIAQGYTQYANFSGWDIYRTEIPLLASLAPQQTGDMMQSLIADAQQSNWLPKWAVANNQKSIMVGDSADPIIADAYAFGATNFDTTAALHYMLKGAVQQANPSDDYVERPSLADYLTFGYIPIDHDLWFSAAKTLEYTTDDFAISQFAHALGDTTSYNTFMQRAQNWRNLFNPTTGYLEPRQSNGAFLPNYDPTTGDGYIEGNAAQYSWMVPYNLRALFDAMGGNTRVVGKLNAFFAQLNAGPTAPYAWLGNEQDLESPWAYDFAGAPWRTQAVVRQTLTQLYNATPSGLPGNDDLGTLSAWYVWSALGLYPDIPGVGGFVLSSPLFQQAVLHLAGGDMTIEAPGASDSTPYIQSLLVNGQAYTKPWLPFTAIKNGGTLQSVLGASPNIVWGSDPANAPPSFDAALPARTPTSIPATASPLPPTSTPTLPAEIATSTLVPTAIPTETPTAPLSTATPMATSPPATILTPTSTSTLPIPSASTSTLTPTSVPGVSATTTPVDVLRLAMSPTPTPTAWTSGTKTGKAIPHSTHKRASPRSTSLPLTAHVMPASVQFHGRLLITIRTMTKAHIDVTLQLSKTWIRFVGHGAHRQRETRSSVLYKVVRHGIADRNGRFEASLRIIYLTPRAARAHVMIIVRTVHNKATRSTWVTIQPPRHATRRRSQHKTAVS